MAKRIPLTQGYFAIVNDARYDEIISLPWCASVSKTNVYAIGSLNGKSISMHRYIFNNPANLIIDHANHVGTDNRDGNLRVSTNTQNIRNRRIFRQNQSGYRGVSFVKATKLWGATVFDNGKGIWLGSYATPIEAALAYDDGARQYYGEYAMLNFPSEQDLFLDLEPMTDNQNFIRLIDGTFTLIDPEDWDYLSRYRWHTCGGWGDKWYVGRGGGKRGVQPYMHREIIERCIGRKLAKTEIVDHINHDTLDHRRENLRVVNAKQSSSNMPKRNDNTSGYIGVSWSEKAGKWMAKVKESGKQKYVGIFENREDAARARDIAAAESYGIDYANFNFPEEWGR